MNLTNKYYIFSNKKLIVEILFEVPGNMVEEYINLKKSEIDDPEYNRNFNFIVDLRRVNFKHVESFSKIINSYLERARDIEGLVGEHKTALITNTPDQVVVSTMYRATTDLPITIEIFSTIKSALEWLNVDEIDTTIFDL